MRGKFLIFLNLPWLVLGILNIFFLHTDHQEFISMLMWYYQFSLLGLLVFPMVATMLPKLPDKGYAISRIISLLILFFINWILTSLGILEFTSPSLSFCLVITMFISHIMPHHEEDLFALAREKAHYIWKAEFLYLLVFSVLLFIQSRHPEIFWGEKPMDYTLLNFNLRNTQLPLQDPWFAGEKMHYYYLGYYLYAGMAKMSGVGGELGYALSIVTCGALFAVTLFGLLVFLTKRGMTSLWGALLIVFAGNLKSFLSIVLEGKPIGFDSFWSTTRVFKDNLFAEYPSWSLLFADLHPHVMSYSFTMLYLLLLIYCVEHLWRRSYDRSTLYGAVLLSLSFGFLIGINGWDFVIYSLFSSLYFLISLRRKRIFQAIGLHFFSHAFSALLFLPMLLTLKSGKKIELGFVSGSGTKLFSHFVHQGHWWLIIILMVTPVLFLHRKGIRWNALLNSIGLRFSVTACIIALMGEFLFFSDRMNTIFKVFTNVYIWGGIAAVISLRFFKFYLTKKHLLPFALLAIIVVNATLVGSYFNYKGVIGHSYFAGVEKGLRGGLYMSKFDRRDYKIISWINENVMGTPTVIERYSKSFDAKAARISMHTGLPTYLGWDGHVYLRGASWRKIQQRKRDIDYIFDGSDPLRALDILNKRKISFIVVGDLERSYYSKEGLEKFSQNQDMFKLLVKSGSSALYGVGEFQNYISKR